MSLGFLVFKIFFLPYPFSPSLIILVQWLPFYCTCFPFKNFWESTLRTGIFCHGVATLCGRKFCWVFHSNFWAFLCIIQAPYSQSLWSGYHWKDLFLLQKLNLGDGDCGQRRWRQKCKSKAQHGQLWVAQYRSKWVTFSWYALTVLFDIRLGFTARF